MISDNYFTRYDGFNSFLVKTTNYSDKIFNKIISLLKILRTKDYILDYMFIKLWQQPKKYLSILKEFIIYIKDNNFKRWRKNQCIQLYL